MIKLKRLLEVQLIKEALPLDMAKRYTSIEQNPDMKAQQDNILDALKQQPDADASKRGDRVYIPIDVEWEPRKSREDRRQFSKEFTNFYSKLGEYTKKSWFQTKTGRDNGIDVHPYSLPPGDDVLNGELYDQHHRKIKMSKFIQSVVLETEVKYLLSMLKTRSYVTIVRQKGREGYFNPDGTFQPWDELVTKLKKPALEKINELIAMYNAAPEVKEMQMQSKTKSYYIVFSKHAYDIAGMSTNRGWSSCMNLYGGSNASYVSYDILEGTMIAYLVNVNDKNINKPIARVAIKPFVNVNDETDVAYQAEDRVYGTAPADFLKTVNRLIDAAQPGKVGRFKLIDTLYCDTNKMITKFSDPRMAETVDGLLHKQIPARTVDEVKYILKTYTTFYGSYDDEDLKFTEADGIWASGMIDIEFKEPLSYCPIQFETLHSIWVRGISSFKNFPKTLAGYLMISNLNTPGLNFEGLMCNTNQIYLYDSIIKNFKGVPDNITMINIQETNNYCKVDSFDGLPDSLRTLYLRGNTKLDMMVQDVIKQLKPLPTLMALALPISDSFATNRSGGTTQTIFHKSISDVMDHPDLQQDNAQVRFARIMTCIGYEIGVTRLNAFTVNINLIPEEMRSKYLNAIKG